MDEAMHPHGTGTRSTESITLPLAGIVVAGGKGTRLGGRDKAFLEIDGEPIIARTLRLFRTLFTQTIIVTRHPERFAPFGAEVTVDRYPGKGPLAGIHAGLLACRTSHAFVAACDMPLLDPDVIRYLVDRIPHTDATPDVPDGPDAIVPWWDGDVEPLHAIYAARTLSTMEQCLENDDHAVRTFLERVRVDYVAEAELARLAGAPRSFTNVNTPEELQHVLERLQADDPVRNGVRQ
jgi:molybdopterin-guanine dinucleotide biosynthesis protein A